MDRSRSPGDEGIHSPCPAPCLRNNILPASDVVSGTVFAATADDTAAVGLVNIEQTARDQSAKVVAIDARHSRHGFTQKDERSNMLILLIILVLVFGGGSGYYGHSRWGPGGGAGVGLGTILMIVLVVYLLGGLR